MKTDFHAPSTWLQVGVDVTHCEGRRFSGVVEDIKIPVEDGTTYPPLVGVRVKYDGHPFEPQPLPIIDELIYVEARYLVPSAHYKKYEREKDRKDAQDKMAAFLEVL